MKKSEELRVFVAGLIAEIYNLEHARGLKARSNLDEATAADLKKLDALIAAVREETKEEDAVICGGVKDNVDDMLGYEAEECAKAIRASVRNK